MKSCILGRYSEIALKGKNRYLFEDRLVHNIRDCLKRNNIVGEVSKLRGRIIIYADDSAIPHLRRVFGLFSLSPAFEVEPTFDAIKEFVLDHTKTLLTQGIKTFRITANRQDKRFPLTSMDIDREIGAAVADTFNLQVGLKDPDLNIGIDIHKYAYVFTERISCSSGLPVGVSGTVACIIDEPVDLTVAYLMLKRGCSVVVKSSIDCSLLSRYDYGSPFVLTDVPFEGLRRSFDCQAVVVPWLIKSFDRDFQPGLPVLTPLIGYSEDEVQGLFARISDVGL